MHNVEKEKIAFLKAQAERLYQTIGEADNWVSNNLKFEERDQLSLNVKHARRLVRKMKNSIDSKPVFALFGASQVGKSYLVKNLLSIKGAPLEINLGNNSYDFLKDINPPGVGAESTGVVTRFSIDHSYHDQLYPVRIKLLDAKDILLIICDSFFSDIKKLDNYTSLEIFKKFCESLETRYKAKPNCQTILIEDDILDVQDYFNRNFSRYHYIVDTINTSNYWLRLGSLITKIPCNEWVDTFSILWNKNSYLSDLFSKLINELAEIKFTSIIYAKKESVLRGEDEILDVKRLKEMNTNKKKISIIDKNNEKYELNLCYLSALSAELTLSVPNEVAEHKNFLKNTDLLDFPGARSRLGLTLDKISEENIPDMYLRGKIAYLFNKYSSEYEINNLLFCQNDKQLEVNEIPFLLNDWISNNIGKDSDDREKSIQELPVSPLFVVFTFFNNQLIYDSTNDYKEDISYKWDTRFNRFFEQEIVTSSHNWHTNWTNKNPIFKNFYLLRDFKYSNDAFSGFEDSGEELSINSDRVAYFGKLKNSFLTHPFVIKHFDQPENSWENSATPNNDGSGVIINNLEPAANNYIKTYNYMTQLSENKKKLELQLKKYYHSDNLFEKRVAAIKKAYDLQIELNHIFGKDPLLFSEFLTSILLSESELYNYFHDNLLLSHSVENFDESTLFRSQFPQLKSENSKEQNIDILRKILSYTHNEEVEQFLSEKNIDLDKVFSNKFNTSATTLTNGVFKLWQSKFEFEKLNATGLSKNVFVEIINLLQTSFDNLNFKNFLIRLIERKTQHIQISRDDEEYLAGVCANHINDFVTNFGFNFMSEARTEELRIICEEHNIDFSELIGIKSLPTKNELIPLFEHQINSKNDSMEPRFDPMIENYNKYLLKLKLALVSNCGFVNYDTQANNELIEIIKRLNELNFSV